MIAEAMTWPDTVAMIALFMLLAFVAWVLFR